MTPSSRKVEAPKSYYDVPMLKPPVWKWEIATYFFLGGLSAGAYLLARMASRFGNRRYKDIEEAGTLIAAIAFVPCAPLLIRDLGDWKRFHYMLRVFKPKSPMNLGTWVLTGYGAFVTLAALKEWRKSRNSPPAALETQRHREGIQRKEEKKKRRKGEKETGQGTGNREQGTEENTEEDVLSTINSVLLDGGGVPLALLLAGYTGVLLSTTATPLWARKNWLGALFSASAISTGASAIELALQMKSADADSAAFPCALEADRYGSQDYGSRCAGRLFDGSGQAGRADYQRQVRAAFVGRGGGRRLDWFRRAGSHPGEEPENAPCVADCGRRGGVGRRFCAAVGHFTGRAHLRQRPTSRPRFSKPRSL